MAQRDRESILEERPSEKRHRTRAEKEASRAHKTSRSSRPKVIDPETGEVVKHRRRKDKDREKESSSSSLPMADVVPELAKTASAQGATSKSSLPYPSFNKAYSKESVNSKEDVRLPVRNQTSPYTPDPTDVGSEEKSRPKSANESTRSANVTKDGRPPSPPETDLSQPKGSPSRQARVHEGSDVGRSSSSRDSVFEKIGDTDDKSRLSAKSKASTALKSPMGKPEISAIKLEEPPTQARSGDSNLTSVAPKKSEPAAAAAAAAPRPLHVDTDSSPDSADDSSPRTPKQAPSFAQPSVASIKPTPSPFVHFDAPDTDSIAYDSPKPPPPPPPPDVPINIPQVDYLLQNGGLSRLAPKTLLSARPAMPSQTNPLRRNTPMPIEIERIFGPFFDVLEQYDTVIEKNGSLAVATGYRSVARRLLDRLENVFNRDLSSEGCTCVMCQRDDSPEDESNRGLGWGEVLEWVSGRRELPIWPAFDFASLGVKGDDLAGLGITGKDQIGGNMVRPGSPVKIDPDVAEEFREHYLQQSKKTKAAVSRWLSSCPQTAATPPQEVDDETLSFAILTHLEQSERPIFNALLTGSPVPQPASRAPTPLRKPRSELIIRTVGSLQRVYRLSTPPRDPEAAIYLLKNPHIHKLMATLSGINTSEWEILTSGRFDGFLWSGADSTAPSANPSPAVSRGPTPSNGIPSRSTMSPAFRQGSASRNATPFSQLRSQTFSPSAESYGLPSRGPTPHLRQPVSNDEETEIAVLAELEREIYLSMETLEDAFEGLHRKAETVRRALRERGAGLSLSMQSRLPSRSDITPSGTPGPGFSPGGLGLGYERPNWPDGGSEITSESDWDVGDEGLSELAPDDSASNISSSRHRRPKRRNERRTPALVEEDEDGY